MMICPNTRQDCQNPGCKRGGCQGVSRSYPSAGELRALLKRVDATVEMPQDLRQEIRTALRGE